MTDKPELTRDEAAKRLGELCGEALRLAEIAGLRCQIKIEPRPK